MNRHLKSFCAEFNLKTKGNTLVYGSIRSYQFASSYDGCLNCNFFTFMSEEAQKAINLFLGKITNEFNLSQYAVSSNRISYSIKEAFTNLNGSNLAISTTDLIAKYLKENNFPDENICPLDGKEMYNKKVIFFGGTYPCYVREEAAEALKVLEESKDPDFNNTSSSYVRGLVGAVVGAVLGSLIWGVFAASLGMICGWLAFLIPILAGFGYDRAKGKQTNLRLIITSTVTLVVFTVTLFLLYIVLVKQILIEKNIDAGIFDFLNMLLRQDEEFRNDFLLDNFLSLVFVLNGIGFSIFFIKAGSNKNR